MTTLFIQEYTNLANDGHGQIVQAGKEPAVASQVVTFTGTTASAAFAASTRLVRISATGNCHLKFGATAPTALTSHMKMMANVPEYFGVSGASFVAAIDA
tara:strand:+ start:6060 stop:6359 length:300 start_codon:yes stop_codon:yes gene_type:complete